MVDRNEINYNKAFSIMNQYKKEMESSQNIINNNNINNQISDKTIGKKNFLNVSGNYLQNSASNISGKTTPKYSSNILNKKDSFANVNNSNNNIKNIDSNTTENPDGKSISIKFINNNIHHYVINQGQQNQSGNLNPYKPNSPNSPSNNINMNNNNNNQQENNNSNNFYYQNNNNLNNLNKPKEQKPEKKTKKINSFRNVANTNTNTKPQTAMGTVTTNYNSNKDIRTNNMKIPNRENIKMSENNLENYINKTPNSPHNKNLIKNNYDNIMVNYSQPMQPGMLNKFNIKQINVNNNDISPINRATRGSLSLQSTINKNNSSLIFSKDNNNNNQYSRPSSTNNKKQQQNRDRSNNSVKDNYNNPNIIASIKRTPSSNSLVKSLTRNYSKQTFGNENNNNNPNNPNQQRAFLSVNRQTPKNYSSNSLDLKNGEFVRNSYTGLNVNMVGIEKKKNNQKYLNANNLNIKSPTLNR
jgi:hypothetical protein